MMDREEYELTVAQRERIMAASKAVPLMYLSGGEPMFGTSQENANAAWQGVAAELGCKWDTIRPAPGKPDTFITAEPLPTKEQTQ